MHGSSPMHLTFMLFGFAEKILAILSAFLEKNYMGCADKME